MSDLPEPLTAADCDLRGMPYMPLDVVRLFDSDFYVLSSGDEFKAAVSLWGKAFLQVPAGSLPDDDRVLAHLSGAGAKWRKVKAMALRGFFKCADGRLYHPTVAEKVADAWKARLDQRARTEAARAAKLAKQALSQTAQIVPDSPVTTPVTTSVTETVTGSKGREGKGREDKKEALSPPPEPIPVRAPSEREALAGRIAAAIGVARLGDLDPSLCGPLLQEVESWLAQRCDWTADIAPALAKRANGAMPSTPGYWRKIAFDNRDRRGKNPAPAPASTPGKLHTSEAEKRAAAWIRKGIWSDTWGPKEGEPGCCIPAEQWADFRRKDAA